MTRSDPARDRSPVSRRRLFQTSAAAAVTLTAGGALSGTAGATVRAETPPSASAASRSDTTASRMPTIADGTVAGITRSGDRFVAVGQHTSGRATAWVRSSGPWRRVAGWEDAAELRGVTTYADGVIAVGSLDGQPAVWTSRDGSAWHRASVGGPAGVLTGVASSAAGALAVGFRADGETQEGAGPLVLSSADGSAWNASTTQGLPALADGLTAVARHDGRWVVASHAVDGAAVWQSVDGVRWNSAPAPDGAGNLVTSLEVDAGELVAVGSTVTDVQPRMWRRGARAWQQASLPRTETDGANVKDVVLLGNAGTAVLVGTRNGRSMTVQTGEF